MKCLNIFVCTLLMCTILPITYGYTLPSWYKCSNTTCKLPSCLCASDQPPLPLSETPQFVLLNNDDGVDNKVVRKYSKIASVGKNSNGCPIPITWFTTSTFSTCGPVKERYKMGDEFACHTLTHPELDEKISKSKLVKEVVGSRSWLINECGLPKDAVAGFRAPFLTTNPRLRQVLSQNGFLYDSSTSFDNAGMSTRPWPYTLDHGKADTSCGDCKSNERYKGMWDIPVWTLKYNNKDMYTMDPGMDVAWGDAPERPVDQVMKSVFDAAYKGNRAPVPIFVHVYWLSDKRIKETQKFVKYALSKPDVYFVTMRQLLEWMKNPVPKSEMAAWLKARCKN